MAQISSHTLPLAPLLISYAAPQIPLLPRPLPPGRMGEGEGPLAEQGWLVPCK